MIVIFSDGGSRGNPGKAACAFVVYDDKKQILSGSKYLGIATNNVAEYSGVILAFENFVESIKDKSIDFVFESRITFKMDSELVVKQLSGVYKIKDKTLMDLSMKVKKIITDNSLNVNFVHVPRSENAFADKMVNEKLDSSSRS